MDRGQDDRAGDSVREELSGEWIVSSVVSDALRCAAERGELSPLCECGADCGGCCLLAVPRGRCGLHARAALPAASLGTRWTPLMPPRLLAPPANEMRWAVHGSRSPFGPDTDCHCAAVPPPVHDVRPAAAWRRSGPLRATRVAVAFGVVHPDCCVRLSTVSAGVSSRGRCRIDSSARSLC